MPEEQNELTGLPGAPILSDALAKELARHLKADAPKKTKKTASNSSKKPEVTQDESKQALDQSALKVASGAAQSDAIGSDNTATLAEVTTEDEDIKTEIDDPQTDSAVDDIVRQEADEVLAAEDARRHPAQPTRPRGFWRKIGHFFATWWRNKWARNITILVLLAAIATVMAIPQARYFTLNTVGVRSSVSLSVIDVSTQLPLKNVTVAVDGHQAKTDSKGYVRLNEVRLGQQTITIRRVAFAPVTKEITVGWGSNPLGNIVLTATGARYTIAVKDFISGKPVADVEADSGVAAAVADKNGVITLTLDANTDTSGSVDIAITKKDYRTETVSLNLATTESIDVTLVPFGKEVFITKQSGKYDLMAMDIDGRSRTTLLGGSGNENNNISLAIDTAGKRAALVSTRDNVRDTDGYLMSTLTLVDTGNGAATTLEHAEQIQLIDWVGTRIIYEQAIASSSASNPQRYKIMSYDYVTNAKVQLATANQFNAAISADGMVYFAVSHTDPSVKPALYRIRPDGTGRQTILDQETWSVFRSDFKTLKLQTPNGWFLYDLNKGLEQSGPATNFQSRLYSTNGQHNIWVDNRDGQGVLLDYNSAIGKDTVLHMQGGLAYPVRWLNSKTIIYRAVTPQEVADYAISVNGGEVKKLTDVTSTYGFSQTN